MKKTLPLTIRMTILVSALALLIVSVYVFAMSAYADVREAGERDRGTVGRTIEPSPPPAPPASTPKPPTPNKGGISNSTTGAVETGGNTGGNVTTGDEHVEIIVVNIGPTNNPPPPQDDEPEPPVAPGPECDRRSTANCPAEGSARIR